MIHRPQLKWWSRLQLKNCISRILRTSALIGICMQLTPVGTWIGEEFWYIYFPAPLCTPWVLGRKRSGGATARKKKRVNNYYLDYGVSGNNLASCSCHRQLIHGKSCVYMGWAVFRPNPIFARFQVRSYYLINIVLNYTYDSSKLIVALAVYQILHGIVWDSTK